MITDSAFYLDTCTLTRATTMANYIFHFFYASLTMQSCVVKAFYPQFIYASFSNIQLYYNVFSDSHMQDNSVEVVCVMLEHDVEFYIIHNTFMSLSNSLMGPVILIFFLKKNHNLIRLFQSLKMQNPCLSSPLMKILFFRMSF